MKESHCAVPILRVLLTQLSPPVFSTAQPITLGIREQLSLIRRAQGNASGARNNSAPLPMSLLIARNLVTLGFTKSGFAESSFAASGFAALGFVAASFVAGTFVANSAVASIEELEETIVVASRVPTPMYALGVSTSTLDRDDIATLGYASLSDLLDIQAGVTVSEAGGYGKTGTIRIRGEEGFRTRIQLDGIDIADPSSPQISPRIEHLLSEGIQRIEVLRGPQGLMYGADAGGVVAITTRQPTEAFSADLSAEMGSNTFQRLGATLTGGSEYVYGSISAATVDTNNFNAREIDNIAPDDDGYQNKSLHATLTAVLSEQWRAGGSAHGVDGANDYDGCFDPDTFATVNNCTDDYAQLAWRSYINWFNDKTDVIASYEQNAIERQYFTEAVKTFETDGGHEELSVIANLQLPSDQRLTMGSDFLVQSLNDGNETRSRNNRAFFAEYARNFLSGNIQVGYRTDDNDDFGRHNSWRVSTFQPLSLTTIPLALTAALGTGFRAPSLYEIAYNKGPFAYAPASEQRLLAETSKGWEVGLRVGTPEQQITATWFSQDISNEIYFDLSGYSGYLQRPGDNRSEGLEIEGIATLNPQLSVKGNVTFNRTEDALSNQRPYRPELTAAVSLIWQNAWLTASLIGRHTQNVVDTEGEPMADYTLLDCSFAANLSDSLQITARIENLTNDTYQQIQGYFSAQRAWYLGLRYQH